MARPRILPSDQELIRMVEAGMTHQQIADQISAELGVPVARSSVSAALHRCGVSTDQRRYIDELPWRMKAEHLRSYPARMLRMLGRRNAGLSLSVVENARLDRWLERLEKDGDVIGYDPDTVEGLWYVPREEGDPVSPPVRRRLIKVPDRRP